MLFNSIQFLIFFCIVYLLYLNLNKRKQNSMLLIASYIFYGSWDWRFLFLLFFSTTFDYFCGLLVFANRDNIKKQKLFIAFSVAVNLIFLGFFKYFNFFVHSMQSMLGFWGIHVQQSFLHIVLPVGISFYTFQSISYVMDIYRGEIKPVRKFLDYALFVSFFPQLVAGPIQRAKILLPQILKKRKVTLDKFYEGCFLIFWGLFLKMVIADNLANFVDPVFTKNSNFNPVEVISASYAFAFQIFGDFAGYTNIARGISKLMGFELIQNFRSPYFATNPSDFWQRWHISLSTWLRDYLYIPLGGNKKGLSITCRNLALTMILGGLWHGAAWTFIIWGTYQGAILIFHRLLKPALEKFTLPRKILGEKIWLLIRIIFFFQLICIGWIIFRAKSLPQLGQMLKTLIYGWTKLNVTQLTDLFIILISYACLAILTQGLQFIRSDEFAFYKLRNRYKTIIYVTCFYLFLLYGFKNGKEFIYFQF